MRVRLCLSQGGARVGGRQAKKQQQHMQSSQCRVEIEDDDAGALTSSRGGTANNEREKRKRDACIRGRCACSHVWRGMGDLQPVDGNTVELDVTTSPGASINNGRR